MGAQSSENDQKDQQLQRQQQRQQQQQQQQSSCINIKQGSKSYRFSLWSQRDKAETKGKQVKSTIRPRPKHEKICAKKMQKQDRDQVHQNETSR